MARTSRVGSTSASGSITSQSRQRRSGGSWTEDEDQRLCRLVEAHGERAWVKVAEGFNNVRDKKQCRERWCNHVNPSINQQPFSADENIFIIDFYIQNGRQWARMSRSKELQGRPDNAIKNHFNTNLLPHYRELCKEHDLPMRQSDNIEAVQDHVYALIKGKVTAPPSIGVRGVKASRFLTAFSCKIENLVDNSSPKSLNERRKRALTLQDIHTGRSRLQIPGGPPTSTSLGPLNRPASMEVMQGNLIRDSMQQQSQWTQAQSRSQLSPYNDAMDCSESDYSMPSPSSQGRLSIGCSPYSLSDRSLAEVDDRVKQPINPWYDASGYYSLPPLIRTITPPTPSALFSTLSFQSNVDEEHKALLHKKSNLSLRSREADCDTQTTITLPHLSERSLLFSTL